MKRVIIFNILLLVFVATINSQNDCDISLQEAQKAYNEKNYPLTKILCNHIISNCGENYGNVQEILQEIEEANNEPFLTLSNKDIFINGDGGDTTINVICNRDWTLILDNSDMFFSVLKKDKCVKIRVEENDGENIKHGYFDIQTIDGTISKRINIYQFSKSNNNTKVEIDVMQLGKNSTRASIIVGLESPKFIIGTDTSANKIRFDFGDFSEQLTSSTYTILNTRYILTLDKGVCYVNGELVGIDLSNSSAFQATNPLRIFGDAQYSDASVRFLGNLYGMKIWENNELVRDFIPVKRDYDGIYGLLDRVNNKFYRSMSSTDFTCE